MLKIINSAIENTREPTGQYFSPIMEGNKNNLFVV